MYSLGIIFFELCHPPFTTAMERQKVIQELRRPEVIFPKSFNTELKQVNILLLLLNICREVFTMKEKSIKIVLVGVYWWELVINKI